MKNDKIEQLLIELLEEVKLLTTKTKIESLQKFNSEYLTTNMRKQMYNAFDGERTLQQISTDIGCKINTLQIFVQALVEKDLVSTEIKGNNRIISKSNSKIALYYANRNLEDNENE